jgi:fructose-1,6-bisphosphatase
MASVKSVRERMQELYVYDLYGFRSENKALAAVLYPHEKINSFAVGFHEGLRKMLVVTSHRLLIIKSSIGKTPSVQAVKRELIEEPSYTKRFFTSSLSFKLDGETFTFRMVSRRVLELFVWAVERPLE